MLKPTALLLALAVLKLHASAAQPLPAPGVAVVLPGAPAAPPPLPLVDNSSDADVAFAAPSAAEPANAAAACEAPCWVVGDYSPFATCKQECDPDACKRGYGVYQSQDVCCAPGVAFPAGCSKRPSQCWVVESFQMKTCVRDDRKCLQGYGVFPTKETCCLPGAAFPGGCNTNITLAAQPCYVVDTYYPARLCRASRTLCNTDVAGVQSWATKDACCAPKTGAFGEGCSTYVPQAPCYVIDSYYPSQSCNLENDVAVCNRGWGVYQSIDVCCAPGAAFQGGCSGPRASANRQTAASVAPTLQPVQLTASGRRLMGRAQ